MISLYANFINLAMEFSCHSAGKAALDLRPKGDFSSLAARGSERTSSASGCQGELPSADLVPIAAFSLSHLSFR